MLAGPRFARPGAISIWSVCMGFALDGLFIFGLALLAKANVPDGGVIAAGLAMASRYLFEITPSPVACSATRPNEKAVSEIGAMIEPA